jgi:hypothetical protein
MQHPVVGTAEAVIGKDLVRVGGEVTIGEEDQLDDGEVDAVLAVIAVLIGFPAAWLRSVMDFPVRKERLCQYY